ncbi:MAG: hypothetical protein ABI603_12440 [Acidobacteriota bacterium]
MKAFLHATAVAVFVLALPNAGGTGGAVAAVQATPQVSAVDAAPFLGEWTLALEGPNGPAAFTLAISAVGDNVAAEISSEMLEKQPISTIALRGKSLDLAYSFLYEGNAVDAVVSLTPDQDGKTAAQIDFAGGAYVMNGTATKKEKGKEG